MSGDQWTARLSEYIDGDLPGPEHQALDEHLEICDACRDTVAQLRRIRIRAGAVEDRPPHADLWPGIAERIGVNTGTWKVSGPARRRWSFTVPQLAAAAVLLMLAGASGVWVARPDAPVSGPIPLPNQRFNVEFTGVPGYDAAIEDLERVLSENRERLDSTTVRVLEESLETIDRAIRSAQDALSADPNDTYLNTHLAETMRRKLDLLRRAAGIATASL